MLKKIFAAEIENYNYHLNSFLQSLRDYKAEQSKDLFILQLLIPDIVHYLIYQFADLSEKPAWEKQIVQDEQFLKKNLELFSELAEIDTNYPGIQYNLDILFGLFYYLFFPFLFSINREDQAFAVMDLFAAKKQNSTIEMMKEHALVNYKNFSDWFMFHLRPKVRKGLTF